MIGAGGASRKRADAWKGGGGEGGPGRSSSECRSGPQRAGAMARRDGPLLLAGGWPSVTAPRRPRYIRGKASRRGDGGRGVRARKAPYGLPDSDAMFPPYRPYKQVCVCVCASVTSVCARRGGPPARSLGLDPGAARRGPAAPPGRGDLWPLHPSPPEQARRRARTLSAAARDVQPARTARSAAADRGTGRSGEPIIAAWGGVTPGRAARARRARPGPLGWMPSR